MINIENRIDVNHYSHLPDFRIEIVEKLLQFIDSHLVGLGFSSRTSSSGDIDVSVSDYFLNPPYCSRVQYRTRENDVASSAHSRIREK